MLVFTHFKFRFSEKVTRNWKKIPHVLMFTLWTPKQGGYLSNCVAFSQCLNFTKKSSTYLEFSVFPARKMFPALNNSKNNKNVVSSYGIFIMWAIFYITWVLGNLSRVGWITLSNATIYLFVTFCCAPVLLPTIYFLRNPKHLISVLQDQGMR